MPRSDGTNIPTDAWAELMTQRRGIIPIPACTIIRPGVHGPKTAAIIGTYRGGTSFIGELVHDLHISLGKIASRSAEEWAYDNYEDEELAAAFDRQDWPAFPAMIAERNVQSLWAFKVPKSVFHLNRLLPLLRNPHLIVVVRDVMAAWQSERARSANPSVDLPAARAHASHVLDCVTRPWGPTLAVSYERGKERPGEVREAIKEFLGL